MFGRLMSPQSSLVEDFWHLQRELDEMLADGLSSSGAIRSSPRGSFPAINVIQTPAEVQVFVFAPGVDPRKLDVSIQQGLLTVSGERQIPAHEQASYYRQERFGGEFRRAISLADEVDPERVDATYREGILRVRLQRREAARPRQIEIR